MRKLRSAKRAKKEVLVTTILKSGRIQCNDRSRRPLHKCLQFLAEADQFFGRRDYTSTAKSELLASLQSPSTPPELENLQGILTVESKIAYDSVDRENLDRLDVLLQHQHKSASDLYLDKLTTVLKSGIYQIDSSGVKMDSKREGERLLKTVEGVMAQEIDTSKTKIVDFAVPD